MIKTTFLWFVHSSQNPQKLALTVKGIFGVLATVTLLFGIDIGDPDSLTNLIVDVIAGVGVAVSSIFALYGFLRKIHKTVNK